MELPTPVFRGRLRWAVVDVGRHYHDGRIYALGALGELRCLNARSGALLWRRNILQDNGAPNLQWGTAAAPLIADDTVIVLPGGAAGRSVAAYRALTGEPAWTALDDPQAYSRRCW